MGECADRRNVQMGECADVKIGKYADVQMGVIWKVGDPGRSTGGLKAV